MELFHTQSKIWPRSVQDLSLVTFAHEVKRRNKHEKKFTVDNFIFIVIDIIFLLFLLSFAEAYLWPTFRHHRKHNNEKEEMERKYHVETR